METEILIDNILFVNVVFSVDDAIKIIYFNANCFCIVKLGKVTYWN